VFDLSPPLLIIIAVALFFDFSNGFHDAANSIATIVSTRVLNPRVAVVWAAFFNFIAFAVFGVHVARTIAKGTVDPAIVTPAIVLAALLAAVIWNLITWWLGLPTSSSHALIGGFVGAALLAHGPSAIVAQGVIKTAVFIVVSPVLGLVLGFLSMFVVLWIFRRSTPRSVDTMFRRLQLFSAAAFSLGHGSNDAQKTAGIITALLYSTGRLSGEFHVPFWVIVASYGAIGLGTLSGGWRIVKTMGMHITKLQPVGGFCAETAGAIALFGASAAGIPVSTTHTITGSIIGAGVSAHQRLTAVRWGVAGRIVWAWVLTMPMAALIAAIAWWLLRLAGAEHMGLTTP
jgi:PiT family inorganic phosphate transporter